MPTEPSWKPGDSKWHPSLMADVEHYTQTTDDPNIKGLAHTLGVSRYCIYQWCAKYDTFKLLVMDMKHKAIGRMPMWGDEKRNSKLFKDL